MLCKACQSTDQKKFTAEMLFKFPELKNIAKPDVWIFPEVVVCSVCGNAAFTVSEEDLRQFEQSNSASAGT
jgi:hypothetical protein